VGHLEVERRWEMRQLGQKLVKKAGFGTLEAFAGAMSLVGASSSDSTTAASEPGGSSASVVRTVASANDCERQSQEAANQVLAKYFRPVATLPTDHPFLKKVQQPPSTSSVEVDLKLAEEDSGSTTAASQPLSPRVLRRFQFRRKAPTPPEVQQCLLQGSSSSASDSSGSTGTGAVSSQTMHPREAFVLRNCGSVGQGIEGKPARFWHRYSERIGGLMVARGLGDVFPQSLGHSIEPDLWECSAEDLEYVLLGSDGVWDSIDVETHSEFLVQRPCPQTVVGTSRAMYLQRTRGQVCDDITAITIKMLDRREVEARLKANAEAEAAEAAAVARLTATGGEEAAAPSSSSSLSAGGAAALS